MKYLGKEVQPLSLMDIVVLEIIEHDSNRYGAFLYYLVSALEVAKSDNLELLRVSFPELVGSFERWKSGESGCLYDLNEPAKTHLQIVK
jgi:hypothetical protein